ncbi:uncharacterized protein LOC105358414 [Oryzias latipes]|uniref:uncharacterized protein LOC105358414 n=1 Tax=Oryzias latipes TaxID=8090 RepID=UPI0009DB1FD4|nr:uncharacterized protein LOC105358414 [Oryzias latipes]
MADAASETGQWKGSEVTDLISIWGDRSIQAKLEGSYRNRAVFEEIAREINERGYRRSWLQCQRKIKSLRAKYKEVKDWNKQSGRQRITCPFYEELDRILGDKPSVQPVELLDSCFAQEEPEEEGPGPAAVAASLAGRSCGDTGDAFLATPSPSTSDGSSASTSEELASSSASSVNSNGSSTSTASTSARSRKRKSKMEATLDAFANKITTALKEDDTDILLKMQAAQHEHEKKMFAMMTRFMERSFPLPQSHQAPMNSSHLYSPIPSPTPFTRFPVASSPSPTPRRPFFPDLNRLPFNNTFQHPHINQPFSQAPGHTQAFDEDPLQPSQCKDDETHYTSF